MLNKPRWAIGLDLGGTNARLALVDRNARILDGVRCAARKVGSPAAFVRWASAESAALLKRNGVRRDECAGIGVGMPGPVDRKRGRVLILPNLPSWKNVPLRDWLRRRSGLEVTVDNDGNAMTMAEARFGAARKSRYTLFLTLGTGIGCGIVRDGKLFDGATFSAAEISHMRFGDLRTAAKCGCGNRGCIETRVGNKALTARAARQTGLAKLEDVTRAAKAGNAKARRFWSETAEEFGNFLGGICNLLNPELIVIGGGVAGAGKFLFDPLRRSVKRHAFPLASQHLKIVPAAFGADAGIIGAAALAFARSEEKA